MYDRRINVGIDIAYTFDRISRDDITKITLVLSISAGFSRGTTSRTNPESIKSRVPSFLTAKFFAWGIAREDKDAREEAVLKSEKLNYIAVKNDARGFSVS